MATLSKAIREQVYQRAHDDIVGISGLASASIMNIPDDIWDDLAGALGE